MIQEFIECDLKRELKKRVAAEQKAARESGGMEITLDARFQYMDALIADVAEKMKAIRQPTPPDPYPTVFEGNPVKVFIKRCVRKLTWWFVWKRTVQTHWHHEMICAGIQSLNACCRELQAGIEELQADIQGLRGNVQEELAQARKLNQEATDVAIKAEREKTKALIDAAIAQQLRKQQEKDQEEKAGNNISTYIDYLDFENRFRGSQEEIRGRVERYLKYFRPGQKVLDLGCGRGEWLDLMQEYGIHALGIDGNPSCVEICQVKQLPAIQGDIFDYLESVPNASLDGITAIQVIEHFAPVELAKLVQLCREKLKIGGRLILETPNPEVLYTMARNFYVDPTHIRPVHPNWLKYLLESNHFANVYIDYPNYSVIEEDAQPYPVVKGDQQDANRRVEALNALLYGATDYAAICVKGS